MRRWNRPRGGGKDMMLGGLVTLAVAATGAAYAEGARLPAALGQFAAAIAHDIRTPLTSISLNVQILRRKLQFSDDDREHLDIALKEFARLGRSVAEILAGHPDRERHAELTRIARHRRVDGSARLASMIGWLTAVGSSAPA